MEPWELPPPFYNSIEEYQKKEKPMKITWKLVTLGGIGIIAITIVAVVALANGIDGTLSKISFAAIGAIVAGLGGYTIGIKRKTKE